MTRRDEGRISNTRQHDIVTSGWIWLFLPSFDFVCNNLNTLTRIAVHHAGSASNRITDSVSAGRNHTDLILWWPGVTRCCTNISSVHSWSNGRQQHSRFLMWLYYEWKDRKCMRGEGSLSLLAAHSGEHLGLCWSFFVFITGYTA